MPLTALSSAVADLVMADLTPHGTAIELKLNGARLIDERSQGTDLRLLDKRKTIALPSSNPNVRLFWIEPGVQSQRPDDERSDTHS